MVAASLLTPKQQRFVEEYLIDLNGKQAAIRAGYSPKTAEVQGARLLSNAKVAEAIAEAQAARSERTQITTDAVLDQFWKVATADPNELVEYRRGCCRYCYGTDHLYQRTLNEERRDRAEWEAHQTKKSKDTFDELGGIGFNAKLPPNAACPECHGEGEGRAHFKDTRNLSANAKRLYLGVKITKGGIEVSMLNPMDALVNVGKHLGMFADKDKATVRDPVEEARKIREALAAMAAADGVPDVV